MAGDSSRLAHPAQARPVRLGRSEEPGAEAPRARELERPAVLRDGFEEGFAPGAVGDLARACPQALDGLAERFARGFGVAGGAEGFGVDEAHARLALVDAAEGREEIVGLARAGDASLGGAAGELDLRPHRERIAPERRVLREHAE